jgi:hypothetical protein
MPCPKIEKCPPSVGKDQIFGIDKTSMEQDGTRLFEAEYYCSLIQSREKVRNIV